MTTQSTISGIVSDLGHVHVEYVSKRGDTGKMIYEITDVLYEDGHYVPGPIVDDYYDDLMDYVLNGEDVTWDAETTEERLRESGDE